jgi:hypothetical protein
VTRAHAPRTLRLGLEWMRTADVATVIGNTRPRATW